MLNFLSKYSIYQQDVVNIMSQYALNRLAVEDMVRFTHRLMNEGIYDDVMLDIIDVASEHYEREKGFRQLLPILGFTPLTKEQAKLIYTTFILNRFTTRPHSVLMFEMYTDSIFIDFEDFFSDAPLFIDVDELTQILYQIDDAVSNIAINYVQKGYNDTATMYEMYQDFFQKCENWFTRHYAEIKPIFDKFSNLK